MEPVAADLASGTGFNKLTLIILLVGVGSLVLLACSAFLPWLTYGEFSVKGTSYGFRGILVLVLPPAAAAAIGLFLVIKKPIALPSLGGLVASDYGFSWFLIFIIRAGSAAGIGIWAGLIASLAASAALSYCSIAARYGLPWIRNKHRPSFLPEHGAHMAAHVLGLSLGILLAFIGPAAATVSTPGPDSFPR
jgi:hypothetical protein